MMIRDSSWTGTAWSAGTPRYSDTPLNGLRPIRIDVRANGMSRAHLEIRRIGGRVYIIDRQSRNGVTIRLAGQTVWTRIAPGKPTMWLPGMSVRIGSRILRLEANTPRVAAPRRRRARRPYA